MDDFVSTDMRSYICSGWKQMRCAEERTAFRGAALRHRVSIDSRSLPKLPAAWRRAYFAIRRALYVKNRTKLNFD